MNRIRQKSTCKITLFCVVLLGLLTAGCGNDDDALNKVIDNNQKTIESLSDENRQLHSKVGELKELKGQGDMAFWENYGVAIIFIFFIVVIFLYFKRKKDDKNKLNMEAKQKSSIEKLESKNNELTKTILALENDIIHLKRLMEEGEKNQVVSQIKESTLRRDRIIKEAGGFSYD